MQAIKALTVTQEQTLTLMILVYPCRPSAPEVRQRGIGLRLDSVGAGRQAALEARHASWPTQQSCLKCASALQ